MVRGDVGAVKSAVESGSAAASRLGELVATTCNPETTTQNVEKIPSGTEINIFPENGRKQV